MEVKISRTVHETVHLPESKQLEVTERFITKKFKLDNIDIMSVKANSLECDVFDMYDYHKGEDVYRTGTITEEQQRAALFIQQLRFKS